MAYMVKYRRALLVVLPVLAMILISNASAAATSHIDDDYSHSHKTTRFHWDPICGDHICTPQEKSKLHTISQSDNNIVVSSQPTSYVLTDEPSYEIPTFQSLLVKIHGNIANEEYATLSLTVRTPHNDYTTIVTHTDSIGSFFATYVVKTDAPAGIYDITANYKSKEITTTFYVVREPRLG